MIPPPPQKSPHLHLSQSFVQYLITNGAKITKCNMELNEHKFKSYKTDDKKMFYKKLGWGVLYPDLFLEQNQLLQFWR